MRTMFFLITPIIFWVISGLIMTSYFFIISKNEGINESNSILLMACLLAGFLWFIPREKLLEAVKKAMEKMNRK